MAKVRAPDPGPTECDECKSTMDILTVDKSWETMSWIYHYRCPKCDEELWYCWPFPLGGWVPEPDKSRQKKWVSVYELLKRRERDDD